MKIGTIVMAAAILAGGPVFTQTQSTTLAPKPAPHQPGVPAHPDTTSNPAPESTAADKVDPAKDAAIRHLMDLTQSSKMGEDLNQYVTNQVHEVLGQALPPERLLKLMDTFKQKLATAMPPNRIIDAAVPIYAEAFSMEDIQALIQFYESPLGQRVVKALPRVAQESQRVGMQMEQKSAMAILQELSNDYPELKPMLRGSEETGSGETPAAPAPAQAPAPPAK